MNKGLLIVVSSPSGGGKGTILAQLDKSNMVFSVSATTRSPRDGEIHAKHYYFLSKREFEEKIKNGQMLEHAVFCDNFYGTPKEPVEKALSQGKDVILEIEVQGAKKVAKIMPECISIFITPPSIEVLEQRLRGRGTEDEQTIQKRLNRAKEELQMADDYDYVVVNDTVEKAVSDIEQILRNEKSKANKA